MSRYVDDKAENSSVEIYSIVLRLFVSGIEVNG